MLVITLLLVAAGTRLEVHVVLELVSLTSRYAGLWFISALVQMVSVCPASCKHGVLLALSVPSAWLPVVLQTQVEEAERLGVHTMLCAAMLCGW